MNREGFALVPLIIALAVIAAVGAYLVFVPEIEVPPQEEPPVSISDTGAPDGTSNWRIYRSEEWGFEVKYPGSWFLNDPGNTGEDIHLSNLVMDDRQKNGQVVIEVQAFHTKPVGDFETYVRNYVSAPKTESGPSGSVTEVTSWGNVAFQVEHSGGFGFDGPGYFIEKDPTHYVYVLVYGDVERETIQQILSTFKFISPQSSSQFSITVLSPNGGETYGVGEPVDITWTVPPSVAAVDILFADFDRKEISDQGISFLMFNPIVRGTPNDGVFKWSAGAVSGANLATPGHRYVIRVQDFNDSKTYDDSDAPFSVVSP